jgi:hypothetical protein
VRTDVDVQKKLLIGVAQEIGVCGVPCFFREETLYIVVCDFIEAIQLGEVQKFE